MREGRQAIEYHWTRLGAIRRQTRGMKIEHPEENGDDRSSPPR